ncbi:SDR family NAD(P)-dependent oxidoreductase [Microlunatus antarcticus]|uniref:NAD(P)-dependent dehydrogenase (Short-subunit alcohol dehydrogenase family) n=1 Tax=Microlunatus antarcticus TaxID=53388 RepID=A0A7W5JWL0_9ACTN|nr:SDR family oxidoreductase [Microlunatus antarcticus]MBB3327643.1 NAD(P)-dependent dehydrogenase (short-subunit alcohol dehydrogenase family) [Microlunatus antarcticus]
MQTDGDLRLRRFVDRQVLVVGGSTGIGLAVARRLAAEGAVVVLADLEQAACEAAGATLPGSGHRAAAVDVTSRTSVEALFDSLDRVDVLVHVSGGDRAHGSFVETDDRTWLELLELNLLGVVRTCRAAAPLLLASDVHPAVVIVGSVNAVVALGSEPYSAAKAGVVSLVSNLAAELAPRVRVNAVLPATIETRVWDDQPGGADRLRRLYPLDRVGRPEDVAAAVAFLAGDDAAWITGHALPVDGGLLTGGALRRLLD